ncbi:hypothetical protein D3C71_1281770 [compost metagenome]
MGPHVAGAERAVQPDRQRPAVRDRGVERLGRLPGQGAAGGIGDRAGDHHRQPPAAGIEHFFDGEQRGLGVERVEDGFHHQGVGAAVDQAIDGFAVGPAQFVEAGVTEAGIVHVRADRCGAAGGAEHADHEARLARRGRRHRIAAGARHCGTGFVELVDQVFKVIVGLADRGRVEGVGLDQIRAGFQVRGVDAADHLRAGQQQQVVVALEVMPLRRLTGRGMVAAGPVLVVVTAGEARAAVIVLFQPVPLDHRAHGAIDDQDALGQRRFQRMHAVGVEPGQG